MVATQLTTVLHPAAEGAPRQLSLAPRLSGLRGSTIGLIDNRKRNVDAYLVELGRLLQEDYGVAKLVTYRKASQSLPTPPEVLDEMSSSCDAIIHAIAF
jgi:hypothetical protein